MTPPQKERIIDQAMQMFATQGIKSVRMDDIAQHLGVSKRTLYELFGDKEGLLYLAMERYFQRDRQRWTELTANARNVLEAMFMVLAQVMDKAEVSSRMMDNLKKFYPAVHDKLTREGMEKNRRSLRGMLDQGIVDGLFDTVKNELVGQITEHPDLSGECLDLLMIAKYLERIGDHAVNVAEWVEYSITGAHAGE
jgi:AcrR family transcriptional regulator